MTSAELVAAVGFMGLGLIVLFSLQRSGGRSRRVELQIGAGLVLGVIGLGLLALYLNGFQYF